MITQEKLDEAILDITGRPDWDMIATFLVNEALIARDRCADAHSWEEVQRAAGFAEGLAYVVNLREMTIKSMEQRNADL